MLPDAPFVVPAIFREQVSMHLMVLGASRPVALHNQYLEHFCLNAPDGAGCFPTKRAKPHHRMVPSLNAPGGAGCFPTELMRRFEEQFAIVSMHLVVLGASRPHIVASSSRSKSRLNAPDGAGCFPTTRAQCCTGAGTGSQCTWWCWVLPDAVVDRLSTMIVESQCT